MYGTNEYGCTFKFNSEWLLCLANQVMGVLYSFAFIVTVSCSGLVLPAQTLVPAPVTLCRFAGRKWVVEKSVFFMNNLEFLAEKIEKINFIQWWMN